MFRRPAFEIALPNGHALHLGARTLVMGILNVTPDSFADGGRYLDPAARWTPPWPWRRRARTWIDVGGESTRPGAEPLGAEEELGRVAPVVRGLAGHLRIPISVDTRKASVAEPLLDLGPPSSTTSARWSMIPACRPSSRARARRYPDALVGARVRCSREAHYDDVVREVSDELGAAFAARRRPASRQRACSSIRALASPSAQSTARR